VMKKNTTEVFLGVRKPLILFLQAVLVLISYYGSFSLRFDFEIGAADRLILLKTLPLILAVKLLFLGWFGLLRGWWRYSGLSDAFDIVKAASASTAVLFPLLEYILRVDGYPRSVLAIDCGLTMMLVGGSRIAVRTYTETARRSFAARNTLIVGAGEAGSIIVRELQRNPQLDLKPVGFVDDNPSKLGIRISGARVLGSSDRMANLIHRYDVKCVLIAIPSATGRQ